MSRKTIKNLLIINLFFCSISFISLITTIISLIILPLPERTALKYMTPSMIAEGQGVAIVIYTVSFYIIISLYLPQLIFSSILAYQILYKYQFHFLLNNKLNFFWLAFYSFFAIAVAFIFIYFLIYFYKKIENQIDTNYQNFVFSRHKSIRKKWLVYTSSLNFIILCAPLSLYGCNKIYWNSINSKINYRLKDLENSWTISSNKPNTMILFFDRGVGLLFNLLLALDYQLFKHENKSFAQLYPEFTSYINTISLSGNSVSSIASLMGSWFVEPNLKSNNEINQFANLLGNENIRNENITLQDWYFLSYLINLKMMEKYGYKNFNIFSPSYYNDLPMWNSPYMHLNSILLEEKLSKILKDSNINILDQFEIVKTLGYKVKNKSYDIKAFQQFGSHNKTKYNNKDSEYGSNVLLNNKPNLKISKTQKNTFLFFNNYFTHESYKIISTKKNNFMGGINIENPSIGEEINLGRGSNGLWASIWFSIQKLKDIFGYMKNLPYDGDHSDVIKNQYDNTNIYIISDHGNSLENKKELNNVCDLLIKNNIMNKNQKIFLNEFINHPKTPLCHNNVLIRKPRKYIHDSWNKKINYQNLLNNLFDNELIIGGGDLMPIIESDLQKERADFNISLKQNFIFDYKNSFFANKNIENFVFNPLENKNLLNTRIISSVFSEPFPKMKWKTFKIRRVIHFRGSNKGFFDKNSWS